MINREDILSTIIKKKQEHLLTLHDIYEKNRSFLNNRSKNSKESFKYPFKQAIQKGSLSLIAEVKRASPSKGVIYTDFNPVKLAQFFNNHGASALSVLTEEDYFLGDPHYIQDIKTHVGLPILRKDFIIDPNQVYESVLLGADAILLIKALLEDNTQIDIMLEIAEEQGLDVIIEVHLLSEVEALINLKHPFMIGINNRNLKTFEVDPEHALHLKERVTHLFPDKLVIAESGYQTHNQLEEINHQKFDAVLIGEGLHSHPELMNYFR